MPGTVVDIGIMNKTYKNLYVLEAFVLVMKQN